jgi:hypothetical protein
VELALLNGRDRGGVVAELGRVGGVRWELSRAALLKSELGPPPIEWLAGEKSLVYSSRGLRDGTSTTITTTTSTTDGFALLLLGESHSNKRTEKQQTPAHHVGGKQGRERRRVGSVEE